MQPSPFARANTSQPVRGTTTTERSRGRARGRGRGRGLAQGTASPDASTGFQSSRGSPQRAGLGGASRGVRSKCSVDRRLVDGAKDEQETRETILTIAKVEGQEALEEVQIFHVRSIRHHPVRHNHHKPKHHLLP